MDHSCALCLTELPVQPILEEGRGFCCLGCRTVFQILKAKNALNHYQEHPLFQQAVRSGLISNPVLLETIRQRQELPVIHERRRLSLEIQDMWCPACAEVISWVLLQEPGVCKCTVDYATDIALIEYAPRQTAREAIFQTIQSLGYRPEALEDAEGKPVSTGLYVRFIIAAFCALNIMMFSYPLYASYFDREQVGYGNLFAWLSLVTCLPVVSYSAWPIFQRFFQALRVGLWGMEALVVMGISAAFGLSLIEMAKGSDRVYFDSLAVIITFVLLGKIIEAKAKFSSKSSLWRLSKALPRRGRKRFEDGTQAFTSIKDIELGDTVVACQGERIVVDGVVLEGDGACDESLLTGEAAPVIKEAGSKVLGGAILKKGWLAFRVTAAPEKSTLHQIIGTVASEVEHKAAYIRPADRVVSWFVPLTLLIALFVLGLYPWLGHEAFLRALAILLIACPCAIGIAAPVAEAYLLNRLAAMGAIVRNRGCLALLGGETQFVFDKTGTLTEGRFQILQGLETLEDTQRRLLKGLASQSIHPMSEAISSAIPQAGAFFRRLEEFPGKGICGYGENGEAYRLGSAAFVQEAGVTLPPIAVEGNSLVSHVFFARNDEWLATITLGDRVRQDAKETVARLQPAILVSGDSLQAVEAVAKACGINQAYSSFSPFQKKELIENLRREGHRVCMVGDGINDAPALASAQIGISVVSATDISIQVSDIVLTTDALPVLVKIRHIALKGQRILKQNLFWAFAYNGVGIGLAVCGMLSPIFAAFAMMASSTIVLLNARRLEKE